MSGNVGFRKGWMRRQELGVRNMPTTLSSEISLSEEHGADVDESARVWVLASIVKIVNNAVFSY